MGIAQDGNRWMDDRDEDIPKIWLEDLTDEQYEALQASRKRDQEEREERAALTTIGLLNGCHRFLTIQ